MITVDGEIADPTVATTVLLLLHVPPINNEPVELSDNRIVAPVHTLAAPVIATGNGFTVTIAVAAQPYPAV